MSRRSPCACFPLWLGLPLFGVLFACGSVASGQFTTVINLPGDPVPTSISAGTQLNILDGAHIDSPPHTFTAFGGEVNVSGGTINTAFVATGDATTNVTGGHFTRSFILDGMSQATISGGLFQGDGSFWSRGESMLQISGGEIHHAPQVIDDSQLSISGGRVFGALNVRDRAQATLSGGLFVFANHTLAHESSLLVQGGDFRIDGVLVDGLSTPGSQQEVQLDFGQYLSATLADGSPFVFRQQYSVNSGTFVLQAAPPPPAPAIVTVPPDTAPLALRDGQTLNLGPSGELGSHFVAGWNSTLNVNQGQIGPLFRAYGANIHIDEGTIGPHFLTERSTVSIDGGEFSNATFAQATVADITGGSFTEIAVARTATLTLGDAQVEELRIQGGEVRMRGGHISHRVHLIGGSQFTMEGGLVSGPITILRGATDINILGGTVAGSIGVGQAGGLHIHGGSFTGDFLVERSSDLTIHGTHFALEAAAGEPGNTLMDLLSPNVPYLLTTRNETLTATLADGSPFELDLFTTEMPGHDFIHTDARLYLVLVHIPEPATLALVACALATFATARRSAHDVRHSA